jgi:FkbM family methyltransferase
VVDIGGYIGDFALFAVADLKASKVITCEPSPDNCAIARKNIAGNQLHDRVSLVEKAVTKDGAPLMLDVDSEAQYRVSAFGTAKTARIPIPSTTLPDVIADFNLTDIDLLKVDCEGGEYDIFESLPDHYFAGIHNIVFEFHSIEGYGPRLTVVKERLRHHGYALRNSGDLIWATRP